MILGDRHAVRHHCSGRDVRRAALASCFILCFPCLLLRPRGLAVDFFLPSSRAWLCGDGFGAAAAATRMQSRRVRAVRRRCIGCHADYASCTDKKLRGNIAGPLLSWCSVQVSRLWQPRPQRWRYAAIRIDGIDGCQKLLRRVASARSVAHAAAAVQPASLGRATSAVSHHSWPGARALATSRAITRGRAGDDRQAVRTGQPTVHLGAA